MMKLFNGFWVGLMSLMIFSCSKQEEMVQVVPEAVKYPVGINTGDLAIDISPQGEALYNKLESIQYLVYKSNGTFETSLEHKKADHNADTYGKFELMLEDGNYTMIAFGNSIPGAYMLNNAGQALQNTFVYFPWAQPLAQNEAFYSKQSFTVAGGASLEVMLRRKSCKIILELTDNLDSRVREIKITVPDYYQTRTLDGFAERADNEDIFYTQHPSVHGQPYTTDFNIVGTNGNSSTATQRTINVRVMDANGLTLKNLVATGVFLSDNAQIRLRGALNLPADGSSTDIDEEWIPEIEYGLN